MRGESVIRSSTIAKRARAGFRASSDVSATNSGAPCETNDAGLSALESSSYLPEHETTETYVSAEHGECVRRSLNRRRILRQHGSVSPLHVADAFQHLEAPCERATGNELRFTLHGVVSVTGSYIAANLRTCARLVKRGRIAHPTVRRSGRRGATGPHQTAPQGSAARSGVGAGGTPRRGARSNWRPLSGPSHHPERARSRMGDRRRAHTARTRPTARGRESRKYA